MKNLFGRSLFPFLLGLPIFGATQLVTPPPATWKEVDKLVSEQKFEEASKKTAEIREAARKAGDDAEVTRALIREVQLRIGLHGYETAVRFLKDEAWPKSSLSRAALNLFYGRSLVTYAQAYGWEIGQREKVESKGGVDLKAWTKEQIHAEAARAYMEVWKDRQALGAQPLKSLAEYLDPNNYPAGIRGTLRDAATYLFVELLADTSGWRPEQSNELFGLDVAVLAKGDPALARAVKLDDPAVHPLVRIGALLDDLEAWHAGRSEREAALEARLERLRRLHESLTESADHLVLRRELSRRLSGYRDVPWWAEGQAVLAGFVQVDDRPGNLVRARALALEGARAYPESIGGQRCRSIAASIERPDYQIASMTSDGAGRRSIEVTHRNLAALHFRAYALGLVKRVEAAKNYNLLPSGDEVAALLKGTPAARWESALPATPDFKNHRTFVAPPMTSPGLYVVIASARADFGSGNNRLRATTLNVTDLVLITRQTEEGGFEVRAVSGMSGRPALGAAIDLYRYDWQKGHQKTATAVSGPDGLVRFAPGGGRDGQTHFVIGHKGDDVALDANYVSFYRRNEASDTTASLVFTDRSVYRPLQKIFWKVVAFQGNGEKARYRTLAESSVTMSLVDPNGQMVDSVAAKTNAYGSAAGEFTVPTGRLLGGWRVQSSLNGNAYVRIEEYKRPTFEATFKDPKDPLRLNKPATLRGEARYYFGLPVVNGTVKWRVTREPVYPWWWGWWWRPATSAPQTVATGSSPLKEDGGFSLTFTPKADERKSKGKDAKGITYRFRVSADVTDEGGETRQATRGFRLGFVSVEARIEKSTNFFLEGNTDNTATASIVRTDLDGAPRAGKGTWRLVRLVMPGKTLLPAEFPSNKNQISGSSGSDDETEADGTGAGDSEIQTPGDRLRPRWSTGYTADEWMREWKDGAEAAAGTLTHDAKGSAKLALPALSAGAYRLRYSTVDDFGATYEMAQELVVAGKKSRLPLPALLLAESTSVPVGGTARLTILSGLPNQTLFLDIARAGKLTERRILSSERDATLVEIPIGEADRGGFGATLSLLRDHQFIQLSQSVFVPWDDRELKVEFATFRDAMKPGVKETWRVTVKGATPEHPLAEAAEVLAYMYDRSLDIFAPHNPPGVMGLYPNRSGAVTTRASLGSAQGQWINNWDFDSPPGWPSLIGDRLKFYDGYGIGGPGRRNGGGLGGGVMMRSMAAPAAPMSKAARSDMAQNGAVDALEPREEGKLKKESDKDSSHSLAEKQLAADGKATVSNEAPVPLRSNFSETAFFKPQLLTDAKGSATIEFTVPDSVTSWNVWVHAVTRDLRGGSLKKETKTVKELMVRPYLPRFLREGDKADIKVVVNNASERELSGKLTFDILDPATNQSLLATFGLSGDAAQPRPFTVKAGGGTNLTFSVTAPKDVKTVAFKVTAVSGDTSDGEMRPLPVLPGRIHLVQSRFVTLKNKDRKVLRFLDLEKGGDPTLINEQMVVTVDAQLFYTVLQALPYLVNYPYECTEQTLNRFVSTGIVSSVYKDFPAIARMAAEMAKRTTPLESWDAADPNRKMTLEESPWLINARGGQDAGAGVTNVLDPRIAKANRDSALAKLRKAQTSNGGFPWWPGGPPSPYMTLYILHGFAKAQEFGVDVPKDVVQRAWQYVAQEYQSTWRTCMAHDGCWEFLTFLNYIATCYPDASWMNGALTDADQKEILDFSFKHWKQHAPYLKGYLSLTLKRRSRMADAKLVWASVMDSAKSNEEQGTFWAPEDRSWLWYNDTIETHAFALRTLIELDPSNEKKDGLVQWLLLNKKLNQWKSTRATAEVIYSLVHYLKGEGALGITEDATVTVGNQKVTFTFEPDSYTGKKNQIVIPGEKIDAKTTSTIVVEKESKGFAFASAAWHFSTEKLPEEDRGDFFAVSRKYFRRENTGREFVLRPLAEGTVIKPGDEIEIQISLRTKHEAEYVHLRDPRAAGLEPENAVSRYKWDLGISWYEETRDSATNFFFEHLPVGEYTFKYRLRANMAGTFRVGPATVQSMYAPEFNAYSAGAVLTVAGEAATTTR